MKRPKIGGAVYILPNLITTGNLFWGFYSIVKSLQGDFWIAQASVPWAASNLGHTFNGTICDSTQVCQTALMGKIRLWWVKIE